ncbi:hypothetical protein MASR2M78_03140 [Treponema sp.]
MLINGISLLLFQLFSKFIHAAALYGEKLMTTITVEKMAVTLGKRDIVMFQATLFAGKGKFFYQALFGQPMHGPIDRSLVEFICKLCKKIGDAEGIFRFF